MGVYRGMKRVEKAVINDVGRDTIGATKGPNKWEFLFLLTKNSNKHLSDDNSYVPVAS